MPLRDLRSIVLNALWILVAAHFTHAAGADPVASRVPPNIDEMPSLNEEGRTNSLAVAFDCLGALTLHARKVKGALARAVDSGRRLLELQSVDATGKAGWPYRPEWNRHTRKCGQAGALPSFAGPCNPPETPYMIQTGYAVACLAQLHIAAPGNPEFLRAAERTIADSWSLGTRPQGCEDCFYYWYGYHPNDHDRYVRNTNLIMGLGLTWLFAATGEPKYRDRALAVARAERREIESGNFGYFGIDDPRHRVNTELEKKRIENHIPHQVKALKDMATVFGWPDAGSDARIMLNAYLECKSPHCRLNNCASWAVPLSCRGTMTIAPCILADIDAKFEPGCEAALRNQLQLRAFQLFLSASPGDPGKLRKP